MGAYRKDASKSYLHESVGRTIRDYCALQSKEAGRLRIASELGNRRAAFHTE